jgi:predicted nucleic acid-binding protein
VRYLLDVNVWVALLDEAHVHHAQALALVSQPQVRIASCPQVENGVIRVLNLPAYSRYGPVGMATVRNKLQAICAELDHAFWPDALSLRTDGLVNWTRVLGHNQITDVYLLALAVAHQGCLATLDHRVALSTVVGATADNLLLL